MTSARKKTMHQLSGLHYNSAKRGKDRPSRGMREMGGSCAESMTAPGFASFAASTAEGGGGQNEGFVRSISTETNQTSHGEDVHLHSKIKPTLTQTVRPTWLRLHIHDDVTGFNAGVKQIAEARARVVRSLVCEHVVADAEL